jgi:hypothetical protein
MIILVHSTKNSIQVAQVFNLCRAGYTFKAALIQPLPKTWPCR